MLDPLFASNIRSTVPSSSSIFLFRELSRPCFYTYRSTIETTVRTMPSAADKKLEPIIRDGTKGLHSKFREEMDDTSFEAFENGMLQIDENNESCLMEESVGLAAPDDQEKVLFQSLICQETMPKFRDLTLPIPGILKTSTSASVSMPQRPRVVKGKRPVILNQSSSATTDRPSRPSKRSANLKLIPLETATHQPNTLPRQSQSSVEAAFIDKFGSYLTYDWSELQLGTVTGSAAWNKALRDKLYHDPTLQSVPQVTPLNCLQWVQSIQTQLETIPPNEKSELRDVVKYQKWRNQAVADQGQSENEISVGDRLSSSTPTSRAMSRLVALAYQDSLIQDVTDFRQDYQFMRPTEIVDRMGIFERRAAKLHQRESQVVKKCHETGLWDEIGC